MKLSPALTLLPFALTAFSISITPALSQEMSMKAEATDEQIAFFEKKIRPALVKHCYECHSVDGDKIKGGLVLDTREGSRTASESGSGIGVREPIHNLTTGKRRQAKIPNLSGCRLNPCLPLASCVFTF